MLCGETSRNSSTESVKMSVSKVYDTYSAFVGHIPSGTHKHELRELFQACGEIVDLVILNNGHAPFPIYGFVRFGEPSAVYRAIAELHGWKLNGAKLVVEIAQDTCLKIQQENAGLPVTVVDGARRSTRSSFPSKSTGTKSLGDSRSNNAMYHSRLLDSCTSMNLLNDKDPLSRNTLTILEDMGKVKSEKCSVLWASVDNAAVSFSDVSSRIMERCKENSVSDEPLGKKKSAAFMAALKTIMNEINTFIESSSGEILGNNDNTESLSNEDNLLKEFSDRLELESKEKDRLKKSNDVKNSDSKLKTKTDNSTRLNDGQNSVKVGARRDIEQKNVESLTRCLSDLDSDEDDCLYTKPFNLRTVSSNIARNKMSDKMTHTNKMSRGNVPDLYSSSSEDNALSNIDSAVIDYHLSKSPEIKPNSVSKKSGLSPLEKLFQKSQTEVSGGFKRSESVDSNTSLSSNEGHIDDSGVESDVLRPKKFLSPYEELRGAAGRGIAAKPKSPQESFASTDCHSFSMDEYVLRNKLRGRGRLILTPSKLPTVGK